ncbi:hypothetical protein PGT21_024299 [Puccinia graminis f. sp. tritici]|uniref:Uncharacterized protein n=1 Tax=Puccinia graminis f. sp. tritici TaxID=56615 RepID=A0A5B0LY55_PUCGR|nr:hypothetical protein PGT21_024299 [Puccinia graminis f. sp. tritici]
MTHLPQSPRPAEECASAAHMIPGIADGTSDSAADPSDQVTLRSQSRVERHKAPLGSQARVERPKPLNHRAPQIK